MKTNQKTKQKQNKKQINTQQQGMYLCWSLCTLYLHVFRCICLVLLYLKYMCTCSISRISPSWARAGCKKTLCLLHYPRKIKFIHLFIHSFIHSCISGESYRRSLRSLLLCLCDICWALINSLVCCFSVEMEKNWVVHSPPTPHLHPSPPLKMFTFFCGCMALAPLH